MDHLARLKKQIRQYIFGVLLLENLVLLGAFWTINEFSTLPLLVNLLISIALSLVLCIWAVRLLSNFVTEPTQALWQAILHLSPTEHGIPAPKPESLRLGRELV